MEEVVVVEDVDVDARLLGKSDARLLDNPTTAGAGLDRAASDESSAQVLRWALASARMELKEGFEVRVVGAEEERGRAALLVGVDTHDKALLDVDCRPPETIAGRACTPPDTLDGWACIPPLVVAGCA